MADSIFRIRRALNQQESLRLQAIILAIELHNFRNDIPRDTDQVIEDAKKIKEYLENGT